MLAEELIGRGYNRGSLGSQFCKVVGKYSAEFQKWQVPVNISAWFDQILNPSPNTNRPDPQIPRHVPTSPNNNQPDSQITQHGPNNQPPTLTTPVTDNRRRDRIIVSLSQPITNNLSQPVTNNLSQPVTNNRRRSITDRILQHSSQPPPPNRTLRPRRDVNYRV